MPCCLFLAPWLKNHTSEEFVTCILSFQVSSRFSPNKIAIKVMLGIFMLCISVIVYGYSGTLTSFLTIRLPPEPLDTIDGKSCFEND